MKNIIKWCKKKYGEVFSERMFLEQLTYLKNVRAEKTLRFLNEKYISPERLEDFFKKEIKALPSL